MPSESIRDLGITFDPTLSFNKHISVTVSSCMSKLAQISRAKHALNFDLHVFVIIINALKNLEWLPVKKAGLSPGCYFCTQVHDGLCSDLPDVTVCHKKADI